MDRDAPRLALRLLGGFAVVRDGEPLPDSIWPRRAARQMVKLLAVSSPHRLHREQILETLWPDSDPRGAASTMRQALYVARRALQVPGLPPALHTSNQHVELAAHVAVDVDHFRLLAEAAIASRSTAVCREALDAYGGPLLPEDRYDGWLDAPRQGLAGLQLRLFAHLGELFEAEGNLRQALDCWQRVVALDPVQEAAHRRIMSLYFQLQDRQAALRQFELLSRTLHSELQVEPEEATLVLRSRILEAETQFPVPELPRRLQVSPRTPFVGRRSLRDTLQGAIAGAQAGQGDFFLVGGEAGVGKTRLAMEAAAEAHAAGLHVLWGSGYEGEGHLPYGPFVDAFGDYLARLSPAEHQAFAERYPALAQLLPAALPHVQSETASHADFRTVLFANVVQFLDRLRTRHPLMLVLDDLHVADTESLHLLHHLARYASSHGWLLLGTYRDDEVIPGGALQRLQLGASRQGLCRRIDLMRLSRADCDQLMDALLPSGATAELRERVYTLCLGNPLFTLEMVDSWRHSNQNSLQDPFSAAVPRHVRELIEVRVRSMEPAHRQLVTLLSVTSQAVPLHVLERAATLPTEDLLDALDHALDTRLIIERDGSYTFRHPLLRLAIYENLTLPRRMMLHGRLAAALEQIPGQQDAVELLAYHYNQSQEHGKAMHYLELAGDRARSIFAHANAEYNYRAALQHHPDELRAARLHEKLGVVLSTLARYDEALTALSQAETTYRALERAQEIARVTVCTGRAHALRGTPEAGIRAVSAVLDAGTIEHSERAALEAVLAHLYFVSGNYVQAAAAAERAVTLASAAQRADVMAEAEQWLGTALCMLGQVPAGLATLERAIVSTERVNDLANLSRALNSAAEIHASAGRLDRSTDYYRRSLNVAERLGDPSRIAYMRARCGANDFQRGAWQEAAEHIRRALDSLQDVETSWHRAYVLIAAARLDLETGAEARALAHLEAADRIAAGSNDLQAIRMIASLRAERDLAHGNPAAAWDRLAPLLFRPDHDADEVTYLLPMLGNIAMSLDRPEQAAAFVERALDLAEREQDRMTYAAALCVKGKIEARAGRSKPALALLDEALEAAAPFPVLLLRTLHTAITVKEAAGIDAGRERAQATAVASRLQIGEPVPA